ncbi:MAG: hypothetical protein ACFFDH_00330 [Promethearchaeota archaeon]
MSGEAMTKVNLKLWRDIRQQKWQFTALVVVILLGVLTYGGMMGMIDDVEASLDRTLDELRFQDFVVTLEGTAPESVVQDVAGVEILKLRHKEIRKIIVFKCNKHFNFLPAEKTRMETCVKEFISIIHNLKKYNALLWYLGKSDKEYKRIKELYNY